MNLYKVIFVSAEEPERISVGAGSVSIHSPKTVHYLCSTYQWALSSDDLIERVKASAELEGMRVEDFTKISLVCSDKAIGTIMRERS
jgi:hypothetical protein